ncbi:MAG TPA: GSU2403 family nucleotidyltransferase fold protein, partial [Burkholderiaceae bacterium]|nr:GSU2403 family nucleotidyltransferase fold protein [Burkholderiaceae bacterium]
QVRALRALGFQVADKDVARLLVELHNKGLFAGGLILVGTLAFMAWLNEFGAAAVSVRTQDVDLARRQALKLAAPQPLLQTVEATRLKFVAVPGMPHSAPSTSLKRRGARGLRVDLLTPGKALGQVVPVPELHWHAQTVPEYDYLLSRPREGAVLAGGHCIPVKLPSPERFVWHKLFSSATRVNDAAKAQKDLLQAATLAAVLVDQEGASFEDSAGDLPAAVRAAARTRLALLRERLAAHPQTLGQFEQVLASPKRRGQRDNRRSR